MWELIKLDFIYRNDVKIFLLALSVGLIAFLISSIDYTLDPLFVALLIGISLSPIISKDVESCRNVIRYLLPISIAIFGFNISFKHTENLTLIPISITILLSILLIFLTYFVSKSFGCSRNLSILLSCGNGICGVSAIAIISALIKPRIEEFSAAIITITIVGLTGVIIYPVIAKILPLDSYCILAGSTLQQTGFVKMVSSIFGKDALEKALAVKAIRISMIAVVVFFISILFAEKKFYVPWFIVAFLLTTIIGSHVDLPQLRSIATILFAANLASIGFTVNIKEVCYVGLKPLIANYLSWTASILVFLLIFLSGLV